MNRIILHSDLNNFYAGVEGLMSPELKKSAFVVCGDPDRRHGIVLAKNGIAKAYGIKTGDVLWEARKKCPEVVAVPARFSLYLKYSGLVKEIYKKYTDRVESFGIDECWLDVTHTAQLFGGAEAMADKIREEIKASLGLTVSVGVSFNKIFSKLAGDMKKPDAVTVINRDNYKKKIWTLPAEALLFVGKQTKKKLNGYGIMTIGDIADANPDFLRGKLGKNGEMLWRNANGLDMSEVGFAHEDTVLKSVSNSTTTVRDLTSLKDVVMIFTVLSESVSQRLRENGLKGQVVSVYLRDNELNSVTRQKKIAAPTNISKNIIDAAKELYQKYGDNKPLRTVGISVSGLSACGGAEQLTLFDSGQDTKNERLEESIDKIRCKFGHGAIKRGCVLADKDLTGFNPEEDNINSFHKT